MKFTTYMAWVLCENSKFSEKIYYAYGDVEFFPRDCFYWDTSVA